VVTGWTRWALAIAALVASAATPTLATSAATSSAVTQWLPTEETAARREALLKQMIARPNDLDLAYANLSSQAGDYEGAISTLERMLIYAPNTPRLQLELGVLYYKIGAYDVARNYFEQAHSSRWSSADAISRPER
jgi:Flp pilus assembly protein TadD